MNVASPALAMTTLAEEGTAYREFLENKVQLASLDGFEVDPGEINPALKPHIQVAVRWALAGGRRALFSRFGTQKTTWHLELMRLTMRYTGEPALVTVPLGARLTFFDNARDFFTGEHAIKLNFIRHDSEIERDAINLTNVESVREGNIDPRRFGCTTFDEGDILRNMATKTFWKFTELAKQVRYRHVATATPDPRDFTELLAYAGYLDVMDVGQARTRFFKRNSEKADELTLHPHKEDEFFLWLAQWSLWITKPSDVDPAFSDDGYELPPLDVRWHEVPTDHRGAGEERNGQLRLMKDSAAGVQGATNEKRASLPARIAKMMELVREDRYDYQGDRNVPRQPGVAQSGNNLFDRQWIIWCDLNAEQRAIERALAADAISFSSIDGHLAIDVREQLIVDWRRRQTAALITKPVILGAGPNLQQCNRAIFAGVTWKFREFIQAVHRIQRYGQERPVRVDIIHSEAERDVVRKLQDNWRRYEEQAARMAALIREHGLARLAVASALSRKMTVERVEVRGETFTAVNNDCIEEVRRIGDNSVDLIASSIPFAKQYEYTPSYRDFGHTDDDEHFFRQMDFLTPELLRVLKPGADCVIHCKDRIVEGSRSGLGFQTVAPFGDKTKAHFMKHGFAYLGTAYVILDVVRENGQTNRLGWTEQCKDGTRMGFGLVEFLHAFRKPQTDRSRGYADEPVVKLKREWDKKRKEWITLDPWTDEEASPDDPRRPYSRARWQLDASGCWRSNGNTLLTPAEIASLTVRGAYRRWRQHSLTQGYDFEHHVACGEAMMEAGTLRPDFSVNPVHSTHPDVWTDVVRMRSLNTLQHARGKEKHICPLPLDIVERVIAERSRPGDLVLDPFAGLMTVPYVAVQMGRRGYGIDLDPKAFADGAQHCRDAENKIAVPTLFDLFAAESAEAEEGEAVA